MDKEELIARFESEMAKVKRPGIDKLMDYIRKSDFYTAPASTKFHLSCESGLLQHSLNVLDALRGLLQEEQTNEDGTKAWFYTVAGTSVAQVKDESVILIALLHDICKTYFYSTSTRNVKFLSTPSARRATAKTETKSLFSNKLYNILHEFRRALIYNGSKSYPNRAK